MTPTLHMHAHILDVENLITSFIKELWEPNRVRTDENQTLNFQRVESGWE